MPTSIINYFGKSKKIKTKKALKNRECPITRTLPESSGRSRWKVKEYELPNKLPSLPD